MIKIVRYLYFIYHGLFQSRAPSCRFSPTCSRYALEAIEKYGFFKGSYLAILRILSCHPFSKRPIYDPA